MRNYVIWWINFFIKKCLHFILRKWYNTNLFYRHLAARASFIVQMFVYLFWQNRVWSWGCWPVSPSRMAGFSRECNKTSKALQNRVRSSSFRVWINKVHKLWDAKFEEKRAETASTCSRQQQSITTSWASWVTLVRSPSALNLSGDIHEYVCCQMICRQWAQLQCLARITLLYLTKRTV